MREFRFPKISLGDDEPVKVVAWHVQEGEDVREGEPLLEVETDKAVMDVESPISGIVAKHVLAVGQTGAPGDLAAYIAEDRTEYESGDPPGSADARPTSGPARSDPAPRPAPARVPDDLGVLGYPAANGNGVRSGELHGMPRRTAGAAAPRSRPTGGGPVEHAVTVPPDMGATSTEPLSRRRAAIARSMTASAGVPQFSVALDIPGEPLLAAVESVRRAGTATTISDLLLVTVAAALRNVPTLNAWCDGHRLHTFESVNIAVAVDTPAGVVAPVVRDVAGRSIASIAEERARLVGSARSGVARAEDLAGATFTVSNVGTMQADVLVPLLTLPQTGALGVGRLRHGYDGAGTTFTATLVADHRVVDGGDGARFLAALAAAVEQLAVVGALD